MRSANLNRQQCLAYATVIVTARFYVAGMTFKGQGHCY